VQQGCLQLSDGLELFGSIYLTRDKGLLIYDRRLEKHREFPLSAVKRIDIEPDEEHVEREWRWKEEGSDEKVYTGRSYPWRKYLTTLTLADASRITGDLSALVYLRDDDGKERRFVLHKRQKGKPGTSLRELTYVKSMVLGIRGQWGKARGGLRSMVWAEGRTFEVGQPVIIHLALKNVAESRQSINLRSFLANRRISITAVDGEVTTLSGLTGSGRSALTLPGAGDREPAFSLEPGQSFSVSEYDLAELFDLTSPGRFTVQCVDEGSQATKPCSNLLTIELVHQQPREDSNMAEQEVRF
jgi:hypothetical protein